MLRSNWFLAFAICLVLPAVAMADDSTVKKKDLAALTWTDPEKAAAEDPDFKMQGEYGFSTADKAWGAQVVALGGGSFDAFLLEGGLPGAGWTKKKSKIHLSGSRKGDSIPLICEDQMTTAVIRNGVFIASRKNAVFAELPRIERKSPTLGARPSDAALVLFDGSSAHQWQDGIVENGLLVNSDVSTRQSFGDYSLHLEFRTPYKPYARGQARGNSGVYHQGRYETQVLDSFGLDGQMNETGGLYSIAAPLLNMCLPPLTWQTYDIDFTAARFDAHGTLTTPARITVRLNGVIVQLNQELSKTTAAAPVKEITPEPGPLFLQHHNNRVFYRNIWLVPKNANR